METGKNHIFVVRQKCVNSVDHLFKIQMGAGVGGKARV